MESKDIDAVILGCTELPLAIHQKSNNILFIDSIDAHIEALTEII